MTRNEEQKGIRSFIGIFPPPEVQQQIEQVQALLEAEASRVKWEPEGKFHITMKFLGNVSPANLELMQKILSEKLHDLPSFEIRLATVGCFPTIQNPRVFWIGPSSHDDISTITSCFHIIEVTCDQIGIKKEERSFHPHVTLGRAKGNRSGTVAPEKQTPRLIKLLESVTFEPMAFRCRQISVMRSTLHTSGSSYATQYTIPLKQ
jgi:RNA 2',3'-cyclic 3'-phosphodiesterase